MPSLAGDALGGARAWWPGRAEVLDFPGVGQPAGVEIACQVADGGLEEAVGKGALCTPRLPSLADELPVIRGV